MKKKKKKVKTAWQSNQSFCLFGYCAPSMLAGVYTTFWP